MAATRIYPGEMKSLIIQKYPNNELRLGWQDLPSRRKTGVDGASDTERMHTAKELEVAVQRGQSASSSFTYRDKDGTGYIRTAQGFERTSDYIADSLLDITSKVQQAKVEKNASKRNNNRPRKPASFTKNARHRILEAGSIIDRRFRQRGESLMVTLTLPGSTTSAYETLAQESGYVSNRLTQVIRRAKCDVWWFFVWELQKRGALHLHICVSSLCQEQLIGICCDLVTKWYEVLGSVQERTGVDLFRHGRGEYCTTSNYWQADVQLVNRSVGSYFSKYVSKAKGKSEKQGFMDESKKRFYPKRWWGMSRNLCQTINNERVKLEIYGLEENSIADLLHLAISHFGRYNPSVTYSYSFDLSYCKAGKPRQLGYGFRTISYFSNSDFSEIENDLPSFIAAMMQYCSNAVLKGDIAKVLHTPEERRIMQRMGVDKTAWYQYNERVSA